MSAPEFGRPRQLRLLRGAEYSRVRTRGTRATCRFFSMLVLRSGAEAEAKFGIVTSRRVGNAVRRNRVRRRLRELHRLCRPQIIPGLWVVVDARQAAVAATFGELQREWLRLAQKLSILRPS